MRLRLFRNATQRLRYAGREILLDPYFAPKHSRPSFAGRSPNPLVDLPCPPEEIMAGAELLIVSHLHSDHFDPEAQRLLPKDLPVLCQPGDEEAIRGHGFERVTPVAGATSWNGIEVTRTPGRHGTHAAELADMGTVSGFVFQAPDEPTLYWAGDTVLYEAVREVLARFRPDVIVTHSSGALWQGSGPIVMDAAQTLDVCRAAPESRVIAIHLDSLDHGEVTRASLRAQGRAEGISDAQLLIPADGETVEI
ncbi:MAG TPA: MBL fold metallo-hydrolase [Thermoanaerobaculia bacterium]|jgi:L-ascorbate metabolism protein UlaG (beta-lactamase superfamily)